MIRSQTAHAVKVTGAGRAASGERSRGREGENRGDEKLAQTARLQKPNQGRPPLPDQGPNQNQTKTKPKPKPNHTQLCSMGRGAVKLAAGRWPLARLLLIGAVCGMAAALTAEEAAHVLMLESDLSLETAEGLQARPAYAMPQPACAHQETLLIRTPSAVVVIARAGWVATLFRLSLPRRLADRASSCQPCHSQPSRR